VSSVIRPKPDLGMLLPYKNDISDDGFTHTLNWHKRRKKIITSVVRAEQS